MNNKDSKRCKVGELRPSQALTTFGIGSIIDLPNLSVMVMGLEDWPLKDTVEIGEQRLLASVKEVLGPAGEGAAVGPGRAGHLSGQPVRRLGAGRHPGRPVPPVDGLPVLSAAGPARQRPVQAGDAVPHRPDSVRPRQLHEAGQAADRGSRPLHRGLQERPSGRLPVAGVRPSTGRRTARAG